MVIPLNAVQGNQALALAQPPGRDIGQSYTLPSLDGGMANYAGATPLGLPDLLAGFDPAALTPSGEGFALPITGAEPQILQPPQGQGASSLATAPVYGVKKLDLGGIGAGLAVQQAQRDVAEARGTAPERLTFGQRFASMVSPQYGAYMLQRAQMQRKQAAAAQIQERFIRIDAHRRAGDFDAAQQEAANAAKEMVYAPEYLNQLDNINKQIDLTRQARGLRDAFTKAHDTIMKTTKDPSPDQLLVQHMLHDTNLPPEALDRQFEHIYGQMVQSLSRSEFRAFPELGKGVVYRGGTGEFIEQPLVTAFTMRQLSDQQREAIYSKFGLSNDQAERLVASGLINPGELVKAATDEATAREVRRRLAELGVRFVSEDIITGGGKPFSQEQKAVTTGEAQQHGDVASEETQATISAKFMTEPLRTARPGAVVYDPATFQRGPADLLNQSQHALEQAGWVVLEGHDIKDADRYSDLFNALSVFKDTLDMVPDVARTKGEILLQRPINILERLGEKIPYASTLMRPFAALISAGKEKSITEISRAYLQNALDQAFPNKGEVYENVRTYLDTLALSNKEAVAGAIDQLNRIFRLEQQRLFGKPYGTTGGGTVGGQPVAPVTRTERPAPKAPGKPGTPKPPDVATPKVKTTPPAQQPPTPQDDPDFGPPVRIR